jgi:hypothetical protein
MLGRTLMHFAFASLAFAPASTAFRHAWAMSTCAPWDGSAWEVVLQTRPPGKASTGAEPPASYPRYVVLVWTGHPPLGTWLAFPGKLNGNATGRIAYQAAAGRFDEVPGRIRFTAVREAGLTGELRLDGGSWWSGGRSIPFDAPIIPQRVFCGSAQVTAISNAWKLVARSPSDRLAR